MKIQKFIVSKSNSHQSSDNTVEFFNIRQNYIQGVPTRYDILWSPRWPTKVDFQVLKMVAAPSGDVDIWVLSIYFQKSNVGWPLQPLTEKLPSICKNLDFWGSNPQKGTSIGHLGAQWGWNYQNQEVFWGKRALEVIEAIKVSEAAEVNEAA